MRAIIAENLAILLDSPDGVKRLRELILQLAVMGRLVPQEPDEGVARDVLKQIKAQKQKLINSGVLKDDKPLPEVSSESIPHEVPACWSWLRLGTLTTKIGSGSTPLGGKQGYVSDGIMFLRSQNVWNHGLRLHDVARIPLETHRKMSGTHVRPGDLLFNITGASIGRCAIVPADFTEGNVSQHVSIVRPAIPEIQPFLHLVLISRHVQKAVMSEQVGVSREGLSITKLAQFLIPIPPLKEQSRIVDKVAELMRLCDELESGQAAAAGAHRKLVEAVLASLATECDESISRSWSFVQKYFDVLFVDEESIELLKKTLMQIAVMGKLGTGKECDEPATSVISRISERKTKLVECGLLHKEKPLPKIKEAEIPYKVPRGWTWARIGDLALRTDYGISEKTFEMPDGLPVLKMGDIQNGRIVLGGQKRASVDVVPKELLLESNDLLYNRTNSAELVGKTGLFDGPNNEYTFASYLIRIRVPGDLVSPQYVNLAMNSPFFRKTQIDPHVKQQCGQANVNGTVMRNMLLPLPPTEEQKRIVETIDRLLRLSDNLTTLLRESSGIGEILSQALLSASLETEDPASNNCGKGQSLGVVCI